jgi:hypothetical protein
MNYPYDMQIKICTNEGPRVLRAQALDVLLETRTAYLVVGGGLYMFTFLCCGFCFVFLHNVSCICLWIVYSSLPLRFSLTFINIRELEERLC